MHRAFELAVLGIKSEEYDADLIINRAINENNDDIEARFKNGAEAKKKEFRDYLTEKLPVFVSEMQADIKAADEVLTEYSFSMTVSGADLADVKSKLVITSKVAKSLPEDGSEDSKSLWINGRADLILRTGETVVIWDYKSDTKSADQSTDEFVSGIHAKYDNQMNLYTLVNFRYR